MLYLILYIIGWLLTGPIIIAVMDHEFDLAAEEGIDYFLAGGIISCWPLWVVLACIGFPLRLLFEYFLIPVSNKILKYFE